MNEIIKRIEHDFFILNRINEYERLLKCFKDNGFIFHTVRSFENISEPSSKICILRRDVDSRNKSILNEMLSVEKNYEACCSYYFRLRTLDIPFMQKIEEFGGEASYHFEEIASYAIKHHLKSREEVFSHIDDIRDNFCENIKKVRSKSGLECVTISSHGEWINRKLKVTNRELLNDRIRSEMGIVCETYDTDCMNRVNIRHADHNEPRDSFVDRISEEISDKEQTIVYILTHPSHWKSDWGGSLRINVRRITDELYWRL